MKEYDFLIVGSGITGLTVAFELIQNGAGNIAVIEKESSFGRHASGRNSGVLHAGIYYAPDSLKAKFCVDGNRLLTEYCRKNSLGLRNCGKVIVATDEDKLDALFALQERALINGVGSRIINEKELGEIEPHARTCKSAIYSPETSVFDPQVILNSLYKDLTSSGKVEFLFDTGFLNRAGTSSVNTTGGEIKYGKIINCAGAYSDKIACAFGVGNEYRLIPFIGTYSRLTDKASDYVRGNIYPVPDPRIPFLGVHLTKSLDDKVYIGPTALPATGRESYGIFDNISFESAEIIYRNMLLFFVNESFRENALSEVKKYIGSFVYNEARKMIPELRREDIVKSDKSGIRPQLVNWDTKEMVMDFLVLKDQNSIHVLNAISPAFTSSMAFSKYLVSEYILK